MREAVASGMIGFYHIPGEKNPADILSKHWGYQQVWPLLKPLLFWRGETKDIPDQVATKPSSTVRTEGSVTIPHYGVRLAALVT